MRSRHLVDLSLVVCSALLLGGAQSRANSPTPFLEGEFKVGDVRTDLGTVMDAGGGAYAVVVHSDTGKTYVIPATAKAGVVKAEHCQRLMRVTARITSWTERHDRLPAVELEITGIEDASDRVRPVNPKAIAPPAPVQATAEEIRRELDSVRSQRAVLDKREKKLVEQLRAAADPLPQAPLPRSGGPKN